MSFINPLSDEGKQIVREDGGDLDRIFDENVPLINTIIENSSQGDLEIKDVPSNYVDLAIKRLEWYLRRSNDPNYNHKEFDFLFNPEITKFDVIAFYILCQAIGIKYGSNSRESRAIVESQGQISAQRLSPSILINHSNEEKRKIRLERRTIIEDTIKNLENVKWTSITDLLSSKKITLQELILDKGEIILDKEDFINRFEGEIHHRQPERMYNVLIGNKIKEIILARMIMQSTENYIKSVHERSSTVEPNPVLLKIAERVTEFLSKETLNYGGYGGYGGADAKASPLNVEKFPPCIRKALDGIKSGGRNEVIVLFLTPFLSYARLYPSIFGKKTSLKVSDVDPDLKITKNEILPIIHDAADKCSPPLFDDQPQEKININAKLGFGMHAELNLQHEGETTWYTPMSCDKVKLNMPDLCRPDKTCKGLNNPLSYYNRKMREK